MINTIELFNLASSLNSFDATTKVQINGEEHELTQQELYALVIEHDAKYSAAYYRLAKTLSNPTDKYKVKINGQEQELTKKMLLAQAVNIEPSMSHMQYLVNMMSPFEKISMPDGNLISHADLSAKIRSANTLFTHKNHTSSCSEEESLRSGMSAGYSFNLNSTVEFSIIGVRKFITTFRMTVIKFFVSPGVFWV